MEAIRSQSVGSRNIAAVPSVFDDFNLGCMVAYAYIEIVLAPVDGAQAVLICVFEN